MDQAYIPSTWSFWTLGDLMALICLTTKVQDADRIQSQLCIEIRSTCMDGDQVVRFDLCLSLRNDAGGAACQSCEF